MKRNIVFYFVMILTLSLVINSCKKDDKDAFDGLNQNIQNIVPEDILNKMIDLGMNINRGTNPPDLEGSFLVSPFVLLNSNRPGDSPGNLFSDFIFKLYN